MKATSVMGFPVSSSNLSVNSLGHIEECWGFDASNQRGGEIGNLFRGSV